VSGNDGGVVIDVRPMKSIQVDPKARRARVGAGVTWGEFDRATQRHGLATTGGRVPSTGVAGLTLGGGSGWLERRYGLACDNLVSVDLVTADGRQVTASAVQHPELFWALHGGGGNFGVATSFEFSLHPVGPVVLAGLMIWPGDAAVAVARTYRDAASGAPGELGSALVFTTAPAAGFVPGHLRGTTVAAIAVLWAGRPDEGHDVLKVFRDLGPAADLVAPMPYVDFQRLIDKPPGAAQLLDRRLSGRLPGRGDRRPGPVRAAPPIGPVPAAPAALGWSRGPDTRVRHATSPPVGALDRAPVRDLAGTGRHRAQHRLGPGAAAGHRRLRQRWRLPELHRQRGPGPGAGRVRRNQLRPTRGGEGGMGPGQRLPGQPEHHPGRVTPAPARQRAARRRPGGRQTWGSATAGRRPGPWPPPASGRWGWR
jgi:FAD binding domain